MVPLALRLAQAFELEIGLRHAAPPLTAAEIAPGTSWSPASTEAERRLEKRPRISPCYGTKCLVDRHRNDPLYLISKLFSRLHGRPFRDSSRNGEENLIDFLLYPHRSESLR